MDPIGFISRGQKAEYAIRRVKDFLSRLENIRLGGRIRFLLGLALFGLLAALAAQTSARVYIQPQSLALALGDRALSTVQVDDVANMFGFELHLAFDPSRVQIVDGNPDASGIQLQPGDMFTVGDGFLVANQVDNELGTAVFAFSLMAPAPPMSGAGTLVQFEVQAIAAGASDLLLEQTILASPDGEALPFVAQNSSVVVEGEDEPASDVPPTNDEVVAQYSSAAVESDGAPASDAPLTDDEAELSSDAPDVEQELAAADLEGREPAREQQDDGSGDGFQRFGIAMISLALVAAFLVALLVRWGLKQG